MGSGALFQTGSIYNCLIVRSRCLVLVFSMVMVIQVYDLVADLVADLVVDLVATCLGSVGQSGTSGVTRLQARCPGESQTGGASRGIT